VGLGPVGVDERGGPVGLAHAMTSLRDGDVRRTSR
jgi:hypothetical protein